MSTQLDRLIAEVKTKLQFGPWDEQTALSCAHRLSLFRDIPKLSGPMESPLFRWRDCEPMLEQAGALLDRALADRNLFQSVGEKYATLTLDLTRAVELCKITDSERQDLKFETPSVVSESQWKSQDGSRQSLIAQIDALNETLKSLNANNQAASDTVYFLQKILFYDRNDTYLDKDVNPIVFGGRQGTRMDVAGHLAADNYANQERGPRLDQMNAQIRSIQGQKDAVLESLVGALAQKTWDERNKTHLADRADLEKEILKIKLVMSKVEWLLDFGRQMDSIAPRYRQAILDAYARLQSVALGLVRVYGLVDKGSERDPLPPLEEDGSVDEIVGWARRQAAWAAALTRRSQNYIVPFSVKAQSGASWDAGKRDGEWSFNIPETIFDGQCLVRIRGMSGWVVGGQADQLWTFEVQLPDSTTFLYERGATASMNQGRIKCRISCVTSRSRRPTSDIVGVASCYNASPIGQWSVSVKEAFGLGKPEVLDDVQLDVYLSVLPVEG